MSLIDEIVIHQKAISKTVGERKDAAWELLRSSDDCLNAARLWDDALHLSRDEDREVRRVAAWALRCFIAKFFDIYGQVWVYPTSLNRKEVPLALSRYLTLGIPLARSWDYLCSLTKDEDDEVRGPSNDFFKKYSFQLLSTDQVWDQLIGLIKDQEACIRDAAAFAIGYVFPHLPDKPHALEDLYELLQNDILEIRDAAAMAVWRLVNHLDDNYQIYKPQSWPFDYRHLDSHTRWATAIIIGLDYAQLQVIDQTWAYLHQLTQDENPAVRGAAAFALGKTFPHLPSKNQAWEDIHKLTQSEDEYIRGCAAYAIFNAFSQIPSRSELWDDLHKLTQDESLIVRCIAAVIIGWIFPKLPNQIQAWDDLHRLSQDSDSGMRYTVALVIGSSFSCLPDRVHACDDLHRLTRDKGIYIRCASAEAIGMTFAYLPRKNKAWDVLNILAADDERIVRSYAYHSLGKASVYMATESEGVNELRRYLGDGIDYFMKSARGLGSGSAWFCYLFYHSYFAIAFQGDSLEVVERYLEDANRAVGGSESKDQLLRAVENLAGALQEAQRTKDMQLAGVQCDLKAYMRYCNQVTEYLNKVEKDAPVAAKLIRKGLPNIDDNIKSLLRDVEGAAKEFCETSKGTPQRDLSKSTYEISKGISQITSPIDAEKYFEDIIPLLKAHCELLPKTAQGYLRTLVNSMDTASMEIRFETLKLVLIASLSQSEKTITNIYGDVQGPLLSGTFNEGVSITSAKGQRKRD